MSEGSEFAEAVERVRHEAAQTIRQDGEFEFEAEWLLAPDRLDEAELVGLCASHFASAEMHSDDPRPPVGRYAPDALRLDPPVGRQLRKQLVAADGDTRAAVRAAIIEVVAFGYMAMIDSEGATASRIGDVTPFRVRTDRTASDVWDYWVVSFQDHDGIEAGFRRQIGLAGGTRLLNLLNDLGVMPRLGKRTRLASTGDTYATAGLLLRAAQSDNLTDDAFTGTWRRTTNQWPYDEYARASI